MIRVYTDIGDHAVMSQDDEFKVKASLNMGFSSPLRYFITISIISVCMINLAVAEGPATERPVTQAYSLPTAPTLDGIVLGDAGTLTSFLVLYTKDSLAGTDAVQR